MRTIAWKAVAAGVGVGIAAALVLTVFHRFFVFDPTRQPLSAILAISYGIGALVDIAVGATAGALARTRGALHGFLAGLIGNLLSPLLGYASMLAQGDGVAPIGFAAYVLALSPSLLLGLLLATIAGAVGARVAPAAVPAPPPG